MAFDDDFGPLKSYPLKAEPPKAVKKNETGYGSLIYAVNKTNSINLFYYNSFSDEFDAVFVLPLK